MKKYSYILNLLVFVLYGCTGEDSGRQSNVDSSRSERNKDRIRVNAVKPISDSTISKAVFDSLIDYTACKVLEYSVKSLDDTNTVTTFSKICNCENNAGLLDSLSNFISKKDSSGTYNFDKLLKSVLTIKDRYDKFNTKDNLSLLLTKDFFDSTTTSSIHNNYIKKRTKEKKIDLLKSDIKDKLQSILHKNVTGEDERDNIYTNKNEEINTSLTLQSYVLLQNKKNEETLNKQHTQDIWLVALSLLLLTFIIALARIRITLRKQIKQLEEKDKPTSFHNEAYDTAINNLENEVKSLSDKLKYASDSNSTNLVSSQAKSKETAPPAESNKNAIKSNLYASAPEPNGDFKVANMTETIRQGATIFSFSVTKNNKAEYRVLETEDAAMLAKGSYSQVIAVACIEEEAFDNNARKIITVSPGIVELSGNVWKIIEKVKIKYQ